MKTQKHLQNAKKFASLLDTKFTLGSIKFGFDPILNIIPGLGSIVGALTSCYVFWIADKIGVPNQIYFRMAVNIFADMLFGGIPLIGVFFDIFYKANIRNIALLENYLNNKKSGKKNRKLRPEESEILEGYVVED